MIKMFVTILVLVVLQTQAAAPEPTRQPQDAKLFMLKTEAGKWCTYADESIWKSEIQTTSASSVAVYQSANGTLQTIDFTQGDEAGDWMVFDHYTFTKGGDVSELTRKINIIPGNRSVSETYTLSEGKLVKRDFTARPLTEGEPKTSETWLPDVPMFTRLEGFPFASLLRSTPAQVKAAGRICTK